MSTPKLTFRRAVPFVAFGLFVFAASIGAAAVISSQPDDFIYTFDPDPLPVTGPVTYDAVPITGKQCFSSDRVFTVTSETWSYILGPNAAPDGFSPFYTNAPATFEFSPEGRNLDSDNCLVFRDLPQEPPLALQQDLLDNCEAEPLMLFRLNAQAIDVVTGRTSEVVIRGSEEFRFPRRCDE